MSEFEFSTATLNVKFVEQDDKARIAIGEQFKSITFTPKNATGLVKNMLLGEFNWQVRASALNASIQGVFDLPDNDRVHIYSQYHPERVGGFVGWINSSLLGTEARVNTEGMMVVNAYRRNPTTSFRDYGLTWEWGRLLQVSDNVYQAMDDNSYGKQANGERTLFPWGYLKHVHLSDLVKGTTIIVYPIVLLPNDFRTFTDTNAQDKAKWLFATLNSIENGSVSFEDAKRQYFTNQLFFRISQQEYAKMVASGQVDEALQAQVTDDAVTVINGGTPEARETKVKIDGKSIPVNLVPSGRYIATMPNKTVSVNTMSLIGRRHLEQLAQTHNGNLSLKTHVIES